MAEGPYTRLYHQIIDEFPEIYSNDATFALAVRLLVSADKVWPESADLPRSTRRRPLAILVTAGLILPEPGDRFRFLGMDKERAGRSEKAKAAADARWKRSHPPGNARSNAPGNAPSNAKSMPNPNPNPSPSPNPTSPLPSVGGVVAPAPAREEGPTNGLDIEGWAWLMGLAETLTGQTNALTSPFSAWGERARRYLKDYGRRAVDSAFQEIAARHGGRPTVRQLLFEAEDILAPIQHAPPKRLTPKEEALKLIASRRNQQQETQG